ncbi:leucine-rich repeat-containing protein 36-like isoform X3 [Heterodontus francisci]|uniref:leucine-rich repeat-containing protein 36-like isoform X3 n=1 Tax=Heterodontus francisci TaxID=7792 RepID=UPI00355BA822
MAAVELVATEEWIRDKAQLSNHKLDEVESLSLQGTYSDKIVSLGDAFLCFKRLKSLDLSRNSIVSLGGLEGLHSLEKLNLYYNNVPSSKEISSLRYLINLKELDLRLNPVTRNEENYRLYVIHLLPNLKKLDDRPVRDSERKAAQIQFCSWEKKEAPDLDKEEDRIHMKKNFVYDNDEQDSVCSSMKYKRDTTSDLKTDLKERWAPHDYQLMSDRQESLCSRPPLSSLYSTKDVKEVKENDTSSKMSIDTMEIEQSRSGQYHSYLDEDLKASSTYGSRKNTHIDDGASSQRSKMTSSSLIPRHGTSSSDLLLDRQSLISPTSSFTSLYSNSSKRGFTEHMNTEFTASKNSERRSQLTTANMENFNSKLEPKKTSSLSSLLCLQPSYDRKQAPLDQLLEVEECGDYRPRTPTGLSSGVSASVSSLLLKLLDLVDQHWNGSRSLQMNQSFLTPAHELLSNLVNSPSIPKIQSLEKKVKALTEENKSLLTRTGFGLDTAELQRVKHQLTQKQDDLETLKGRLAKVLDENNKLRSQLTSLELANCAGNQLQNKDLQKDNERLNLEVEYLNQQIKQYNKLQETVTMLQESHRSLVSTNNYLQQQLNVNGAGQNTDMSHHLGSHRTKAWSKLPPSEITELPLSRRSHHSNSDIL